MAIQQRRHYYIAKCLLHNKKCYTGHPNLPGGGGPNFLKLWYREQLKPEITKRFVVTSRSKPPDYIQIWKVKRCDIIISSKIL